MRFRHDQLLRAKLRSGDTALAVILALSFIAVTALLGLLLSGSLGKKMIPRLPPLPEETAEAKYREAAAAFTAGLDNADDHDVKAIAQVFALLTRSRGIGDSKPVAEQFDLDRMAQEILRCSRIEFDSPSEQQQFIASFKQGFISRANSTALPTDEQLRLRHCKLSADRNEAVAFICAQTQTASIKYRYWLTKHDGQWLIYDLEEIDCGTRLSKNSAIILDAESNPEQLNAIKKMEQLKQAAESALASGELDEADRAYERAAREQTELPKRAELYTGRGAVLLARGQYRDALTLIEMASQVNPDYVLPHLLRAKALNQLGEFEAARRAAEKYLSVLGPQANGFEQLGVALEGLSRVDEATSTFRRALDENPDCVLCLLRLAATLPKHKKQEVGERFAKTQRTPAQFDLLFDLLYLSDPVSLREIAKEFAKVQPGNPKISYVKVGELFDLGDYEAAVRLAKPALGAFDEPFRSDLLRWYGRSLVKLDRATEAYMELGQSEDAFGRIGLWMVLERKIDGLEELIAAHRLRWPNDPTIHYFNGHISIHRQQTDEALRQLQTAIDFTRDDALAMLARHEMIRALFEAGRALEAFERLEPKAQVFEQLAQAAIDKKQAELLAALLDALRRRMPDSPDLPHWEMELAYLKRDYIATITLVRQQRQASPQAVDRRALERCDRAIRSFIHLGRFDLAEQELLAVHFGDSAPPLFRALIVAAQGDVTKTATHLQQLTAVGCEPYEFYEDDILGPALRSNAFKTLREVYPEPKEGQLANASN